MTDRVRARIERDYRDSDPDAARALVQRIGAELSIWKEVSAGDRVEFAALTFAGGQLASLRDAVDLAMRDWRDLLVAVGDA